MPRLHCFLFLATFLCVAGVFVAGDGEADPLYKDCVEQCKKSGCVGNRCFQHCKFSSDGKPIDGPCLERKNE
ncbi:hypothetical protein K1719_047134 [Acacia pycnantha]|nr:hypothetical protein K1719_047134 [Acacia pycnantha]